MAGKGHLFHHTATDGLKLTALILRGQQEPQLISITLAAIRKNPIESRLEVEMAFTHFNTGNALI